MNVYRAFRKSRSAQLATHSYPRNLASVSRANCEPSRNFVKADRYYKSVNSGRRGRERGEGGDSRVVARTTTRPSRTSASLD